MLPTPAKQTKGRPTEHSSAALPVSPMIGDVAPIELQVDRSRVLRNVFAGCVLAEFAFLALDVGVNYGRGIDIVLIRRLCNITREDGLASWFAVTQTFAVGLTLFAIWALSRRTASRGVRFGWITLAGFFIYLSMDDGAMIHERIGSTVDGLRDDPDGGGIAGFPSYAWQSVFLPILGGFGIFMLVFLLKHLTTRRQRMGLIAAMGCLALSIAFDFFEGLDAAHPWNVYTMLAERFNVEGFAQARFGVADMEMLVHFSKAIEETLEMFAFTLLLTTFLSHLMRSAGDLRLRFIADPCRS